MGPSTHTPFFLTLGLVCLVAGGVIALVGFRLIGCCIALAGAVLYSAHIVCVRWARRDALRRHRESVQPKEV